MGVPEDHLTGHAFHTYTLTSPDDSVQVTPAPTCVGALSRTQLLSPTATPSPPPHPHPHPTPQFQFKHNVVERSIYAEGTVDAVLFLAKKRAEGAEKKVYNMVDVLLEGHLRAPRTPS